MVGRSARAHAPGKRNEIGQIWPTPTKVWPTIDIGQCCSGFAPLLGNCGPHRPTLLESGPNLCFWSNLWTNVEPATIAKHSHAAISAFG